MLMLLFISCVFVASNFTNHAGFFFTPMYVLNLNLITDISAIHKIYFPFDPLSRLVKFKSLTSRGQVVKSIGLEIQMGSNHFQSRFLKQETLHSLLGTGWFQERIQEFVY